MSTVSTIMPTTSAPPPHGTCRLHILEASRGIIPGNIIWPLNVELNLTAGDNAPTISTNFTVSWGDVTAILSHATGLPYDVSVNFVLWGYSNESMDNEGIYNFEDWPVLLTAGSNMWTNNRNDSSQLPYCKVGGWDNGNAAEASAINALELLPNSTFEYVSFFRGH
jgi:hypothetical protein